MASNLHTTGPTRHLHPSAEQPHLYLSNEDQLCLHEVDAEMLYASEPDDDPLIAAGVDILPPTAFSDATDNQMISQEKVSNTDLAQKQGVLTEFMKFRLALGAISPKQIIRLCGRGLRSEENRRQ